MIEVELNAHVGRTNFANNISGVLDTVEKIIRPVARVDRLDQERDVRLRGVLCSAREIFDEGGLGGWTLVRRYGAGKAVNGAAADGDDIVECLSERRIPIALASGHCGEAELAVPALCGVHAELYQAMPFEFSLHGRRRHTVGKLQLDRLEARRRRSAKALDQRPFGEEITKIGCKAGHGISLSTVVRRQSMLGTIHHPTHWIFFPLSPRTTRVVGRENEIRSRGA